MGTVIFRTNLLSPQRVVLFMKIYNWKVSILKMNLCPILFDDIHPTPLIFFEVSYKNPYYTCAGMNIFSQPGVVSKTVFLISPNF
jgi:hypothetical protein